jgi:hypothetical protein
LRNVFLAWDAGIRGAGFIQEGEGVESREGRGFISSDQGGKNGVQIREPGHGEKRGKHLNLLSQRERNEGV